MKRLWVGALGLALGWLGPRAGAEELHWRPATPEVRVVATGGGGAANDHSPPAVVLGPAVPLTAPELPADNVIRLASFSTPAGPGPRVVRGRAPDGPPSRLPDLFAAGPGGSSTGKNVVPTSFASEQGPPLTAPNLIVEAPPAPPAVEQVPGPRVVEGAPEILTSEAPPSGDCAGPACPAACPDACPCPPGDSSRNMRLWASGEYLYWRLRNPQIPTLVTTGPATGPFNNGIIGQPGTVALLGPGSLEDDFRSGARFRAGVWFDDCQTWGIEGGLFFLNSNSINAQFSSNVFPLLARPFIDQAAGFAPSAEVATRPDLATGTINSNYSSRLWGAEANLRYNLCCGCTYRVDLIGGFRYLDLRENLAITEDLTAGPGTAFAGDNILVMDDFATRNQFYGGQLGAVSEFHWGKWFADLRTVVALGDTHQAVDILGGQVITTPTGTVNRFTGGLLALYSNIGHHTKDVFAVVPEVGLNLGYQVNDHIRVFAGYNFLYWSKVLRPGDQIDPVLDSRQIPNFLAPGPGTPTGTHPIVPFKETGLWAQGINVGLEFRY